MTTEHEEIKSLIAPYVLGAVSDEETALVRSHILTCEECMAEADGYSDVVGALSMAVEDEQLPEGLVEDVLEKVEVDRPTPHLEAEVRPIRRSRWTLVPSLAVAALLLITAVLAALLVDTRTDLTTQERFVAALVDRGGMRLTGEENVVAVMVPTEDGGVFVSAGLDEAPSGKTYQLWLIDEGAPASAGTFEVDEGLGVLATDASVSGVDGVAVTVEPDGGSDEPTSDPIISTS